MENKRIYIVLTKTNTLLSTLIGIIKKDEYTHASISLNKSLSTMYSFGRKYTYNPFVGRFVEENLNEGVFGLQKRLNGLVMELEVSTEQYDEIRCLLNEFIENSTAYKYNYLGLINSLLNIESCSRDKFLCSEFVYYILSECGTANLYKPRNLVTPQDLLKVNGRVIFKGNLKNETEILPTLKYVEI